MRRRAALLSVSLLSTAVVVPAAFAVHGDGPAASKYYVGGASESIDPTPAMLANDDFYLGGYGFSSAKLANKVTIPGATAALGDRHATGILADGRWGPDGDGVHTRAFAVSDGSSTIVLGQIETQGYFNAYKQGPFGINEIRQDASKQIAALAATAAAGDAQPDNGRDHKPQPVPTASQIVVDSDHSHGGPDTAGVWGGVPTSYLKLVHDQTVKAIVEAWQSMRPGTLRYGVAQAGVNGEAQYPPEECIRDGNRTCDPGEHPDWLLNNQFSSDPNNQTMDGEVRVLQAYADGDGEPFATYVNFSAHPTVLGSSNTKVTGDYVGRLDGLMEDKLGGFAMDQVATLGRTQPTDRGCNDKTVPSDQDSQNLCALDQYAGRVFTKVQDAIDNEQTLTGPAKVAMNSYLLNDPTTSAVLAGIVYAGQVIGAPAGRAMNAPWYTGNVLGTSVFSGRIGDILISGGPGEMYPQIVDKVRQTVEATAAAGNGPAIRGEINVGTAGDFLGYIIAPLEAYPCPAEASVVSGTCNASTDTNPTSIGPDPIGNDNYFFNISHTFGERLTCDLLRGAGDILTGDKSTYWSQYDRCPAFINDYELAPGTDTQFPEQPDLSGLPTMDHM